MAFIAAGKYKRKQIIVPKGEVRPAQRLLRLAVFNFLGEYIEDASVLDLYAGAGTFGIEALSRGARKVVFVDVASKSIQAIRENIISVGIKDKTAVYQLDTLEFLVKSIKKHRKFDIIFIDPPFTKLYKMKNDERDSYILELLDRSRMLLNEKSLIIFKHPKKFVYPVPDSLKIIEERRYGINKISYIGQKEYIIEDEE